MDQDRASPWKPSLKKTLEEKKKVTAILEVLENHENKNYW